MVIILSNNCKSYKKETIKEFRDVIKRKSPCLVGCRNPGIGTVFHLQPLNVQTFWYRPSQLQAEVPTQTRAPTHLVEGSNCDQLLPSFYFLFTISIFETFF